MQFVNRQLSRLFDLALDPLAGLQPLWVLVPLALVVTVPILLAFKYLSNQKKIEAAKADIHAGLFEIRLFNDRIGAIVKAMGSILARNGAYLGWSLLAFVPLFPLLIPVLGQLHYRYGYDGLRPGETTTFEVVLTEPRDVKPLVEIDVPTGLALDSPAVWLPADPESTDPERRRFAWRLRAEEPGTYKVAVTVEGQTLRKDVVVSDRALRRSPVRPGPGWLDQLVYPAEPPVPEGAIFESLSVQYPPADGGIGWESELSWMVVFFVLTIVFGLALRKRLGVTI